MPHPLAGKPAPSSVLVDVDRLIKAYYQEQPDPADPEQQVAFGTSGHRGTSLKRSFNEAHILAITQALCEYRKQEGITGPLYLGKDTHAPVDPRRADRAGGAGGQRRHHHHPERRRLHADPGHLARHPHLQPPAQRRPGRRHRGHAVAQPARGRRLQVQPAQRRPGRHQRHRLDPGSGQRPPARRQQRSEAPALRARASPPTPPSPATWSIPTCAIWRTCWTWRRSAAPTSAAASIPWVARRWPTTRRWPSATSWS